MTRGWGKGRVAQGDCSPRAPTDPDVRIARIWLVMSGTRYRCAIRCRFVDTSTGSDGPAMFPSNGVMTRRPLPSTGSLRNGSPASTVLRDPPTPRRPSRRASLPSLGDTTVASPVCSRRSATRDRGLRGVGIPVPEPGIAVETTGSPRFLGNPDGHGPCSPTPVGPAALCGTRCEATDAAPAYVHDEGSGHL